MFHLHTGTGLAGLKSLSSEMKSISLSNEASAAFDAGRIDESISLYQQSLALKLRSNPELCVKTGITYNGIGVSFLRAGRLEEADESFSKALLIREKEGPLRDVADTRDMMGQLREAQGRFEEAREVRLRGAAKNNIMCGNYDCPTHAVLPLAKLSACSACKSVFYCSKTCQKNDWTTRHKTLCQAYMAASQQATPADTEAKEPVSQNKTSE
ncbi:hypothetical protein F4806DRAFT_496876 [Annulohypoxylon nitens]|nr:hypothetical protein F4806DRAFT_496876 [Annulohypoxylon nitens]